MKKLIFVLFVFAMMSCEKAMDDVQPFQTGNEENFRLKDSTINPNLDPNGGDDDEIIIDP